MRGPLKVVSGGQTGVDRAALDAAMALGLCCGGWCPLGRRAEDGALDQRYPLREASTADYAQRTLLNVCDSDGTLILYRRELTGGTLLTRQYALARNKPHFLVDMAETSEIGPVLRWIQANDIQTLNVAGPRESKEPGIYHQARRLLEDLLAQTKADQAPKA